MKLMCGEDGPLGGASMTPYMGEGWSHDQAGVKEIGAQLQLRTTTQASAEEESQRV